MRGVNSSVETVNAAASAIISAERRVQQVTVPRRRWGACFNIYWCFGSSHSQSKRINHSVLVPEPVFTAPDAPISENPDHPPLTLPFIVPPSSPASILNSEPPSSAQSPGGLLSLSALSANSYSPTGPASIFTIGPYAYETQLVSPPVFSTFTTEPSTAPFTPPSESVQLTTPSSPEVPFACLLSSFDSNSKKREAYEFQLYQLFPGSPIGHLISPSSVCSGTSSPFPDLDSHSSQRQSSILDGHIPEIVAGSDEQSISHRVSFELTVEEVARCMEKKPSVVKLDVLTKEAEGNCETDESEINSKLPERIESSGELVGSKEFKFRNSDEKVIIDEAMPSKNWAFFPMVQPRFS